ncbi:MAG: lipid-binding SYLF domain-containing protein [Acidobacteriia bacterium]|nr:lipid-binding SYLF domain-containing protein [Terriglobia bacterium]
MSRFRSFLTAAALTVAVSPFAMKPLSAAEEKDIDRLNDAATVFSEIMDAPDKGIPQDLLEKANCIVIVPGLKKGAFIVGAKYGKGFVSCRDEKAKRNWSAPGAVRVEGGSLGFQIGGSETDVILLVMNKRGADRLLSSQFTLGGEGEVAAGPVGRSATAQTDAKFTAEILSWSRTRGVFAGVSLQGATLRQDEDVNKELYGKKIDNRNIVDSGIAPPHAAEHLLSLLNRYSPHEK